MRPQPQVGRYRQVPPAGHLSAAAWVICDLHLKGEHDELQLRFLAWLQELPRGETLWILGDLFEYWIGAASLLDPGVKPVLEALAARTRTGGFVGLVPGNRDFLIDHEFEAETGVCVCPEGTVVPGPGGPWLLVHGDEFCILDHGYQRLKRVLRSGIFRFWARHQPAFLGRAMARRLRRASQRSVPAKDPERLAMQTAEVRERAVAAGAQAVLCGHAHRFHDGVLGAADNGGHPLRFLVLDAFGHGDRDVLRFAGGEPPGIRSSTDC